jgi:hypothetical protein
MQNEEWYSLSVQYMIFIKSDMGSFTGLITHIVENELIMLFRS